MFSKKWSVCCVAAECAEGLPRFLSAEKYFFPAVFFHNRFFKENKLMFSNLTAKYKHSCTLVLLASTKFFETLPGNPCAC